MLFFSEAIIHPVWCGLLWKDTAATGARTLPIGELESLQFLVKFTLIFISLTKLSGHFIPLLENICIILILKKKAYQNQF